MYNIAESVFKYSAYLTHRLFNKVNTINDFFSLEIKSNNSILLDIV